MKFIITDTKLVELMNNYLDGKIVNNISRIDNYILLFDNYNDSIDWDGVLLEYDSNDGRLYIYHKFLNNFHSLFPIGKNNIEDFIKHWFEDRFKVDIRYISLGS